MHTIRLIFTAERFLIVLLTSSDLKDHADILCAH